MRTFQTLFLLFFLSTYAILAFSLFRQMLHDLRAQMRHARIDRRRDSGTERLLTGSAGGGSA